MRTIISLFAVLFVIAGCVSSARFYKTTKYVLPPRESHCDFDVMMLTPSSNFKEIGLLVFEDGQELSDQFVEAMDSLGSLQATLKKEEYEETETKNGPYGLYLHEIKEIAGPKVCANGGNALILSPPKGGKYQRGVVITIEE